MEKSATLIIHVNVINISCFSGGKFSHVNTVAPVYIVDDNRNRLS